jgi:hypothetical protein
MSSSYLIQPVPKVITYYLHYITISVQQLQLNTQAIITVFLYDEKNVCRDTQVLTMEGQDYQNWTSDEYVFDWVCQQLGLKPLPTNVF